MYTPSCGRSGKLPEFTPWFQICPSEVDKRSQPSGSFERHVLVECQCQCFPILLKIEQVNWNAGVGLRGLQGIQAEHTSPSHSSLSPPQPHPTQPPTPPHLPTSGTPSIRQSAHAASKHLARARGSNKNVCLTPLFAQMSRLALDPSGGREGEMEGETVFVGFPVREPKKGISFHKSHSLLLIAPASNCSNARTLALANKALLKPRSSALCTEATGSLKEVPTTKHICKPTDSSQFHHTQPPPHTHIPPQRRKNKKNIPPPHPPKKKGGVGGGKNTRRRHQTKNETQSCNGGARTSRPPGCRTSPGRPGALRGPDPRVFRARRAVARGGTWPVLGKKGLK